ncbi:MAG: hypothetical protein KKI08_14860 [Armatimonadetes bacterium]|nr:hypothetical protein [Armatimonadota bacterium]
MDGIPAAEDARPRADVGVPHDALDWLEMPLDALALVSEPETLCLLVNGCRPIVLDFGDLHGGAEVETDAAGG